MKEVPSIFEGFVSKKGEDNARWKMRYFVLKPGFFYYSKPKDDKPLGLVFLPKQLTVVDDSSRQSNFKVMVKWPDRTYFLACENKGEWIGHLKSAVVDVPLGKAGRERNSFRGLDGLSKLLSTEAGFASFKRFLESEFSVENLLLWQDINRFRKLETRDELQTAFHTIYSRYFDRESAQPVNLPHSSRIAIEKAKQDLNSVKFTTFDAIQHDILVLMKLDSFTRYKNSSYFATFLDDRLRGMHGSSS